MRRIIIIFLVFFSTHFLYATSAIPYPVEVTLPDGVKLFIRVRGDEFFHYTTTLDGYVIAQKEDGYYYYADYLTGKLRVSNYKVGCHTTKSFIKSNYIPYQLFESARARRAEVEKTSMSVQKSTLANSKNVKTIIIPVQFEDEKFTMPNPTLHFDNMVNQLGYSDYGGTGSVKDYFSDNLGDFFDFSFTVSDVVTLPKNIEYYCGNDAEIKDVRVRDAIISACDIASCGGVDFSQFDVNGDGVVDNIFILFAGGNEAVGASQKYVWPHCWSVKSYNHRVDGVLLGTYACCSEYGLYDNEISGIGTFCHEFGHLLGFVDVYDTDYENNGQSKGFWGVMDLMDAGNFNNNGRTPPVISIVHREHIGVADIEELNLESEYSLSGVISSNKGYKVKSDNENEYYLMECRIGEGWDKYLGVKGGLLVYHIDKSSNVVNSITASTRWETNKVNTYSEHQCAYILEANFPAKTHKDLFFPGIGNISSLDAKKDPLFLDWSSNNLGIALTDILFENSNVSFKTIEEKKIVFPKIRSFDILALQDEAFFRWQSDPNGDFEWNIIYGEKNDAPSNYQHKNTNNYNINITGLSPRKDYICGIYSVIENVASDTLFKEFSSSSISSIYPYIFLQRSNFIRGEKIYLKLQNITERIKYTHWSINGKSVFGGAHILEDTGEVEIAVRITYWSDGSVEYISRKIKVRADE